MLHQIFSSIMKSSCITNINMKKNPDTKMTPSLTRMQEEHGVWVHLLFWNICIYCSVIVIECSPMARDTWVQSQVESYQRLKKWYLMPPCLTLSIIRYRSRVKWRKPGKGVAPSPTPRCSSYRKGRFRVTLDFSCQLYFTTLMNFISPVYLEFNPDQNLSIFKAVPFHFPLVCVFFYRYIYIYIYI